MSIIAERLIAAREKAGLSQRELSSLTGISHSTISRMESGDDFNMRSLLFIAKRLGISLDWLFDTGKVRESGVEGISVKVICVNKEEGKDSYRVNFDMKDKMFFLSFVVSKEQYEMYKPG